MPPNILGGALCPAREDPCSLGKQIQGWVLEQGFSAGSLVGFEWPLPRAPLLVAPLLSIISVHIGMVHSICQQQSGSSSGRGGSSPHSTVHVAPMTTTYGTGHPRCPLPFAELAVHGMVTLCPSAGSTSSLCHS